jgi:hypothetical protein
VSTAARLEVASPKSPTVIIMRRDKSKEKLKRAFAIAFTI